LANLISNLLLTRPMNNEEVNESFVFFGRGKKKKE
jgi:hypothetical protein